MLVLFTFWYIFSKANTGCFFLCVMLLSEALVRGVHVSDCRGNPSTLHLGLCPENEAEIVTLSKSLKQVGRHF